MKEVLLIVGSLLLFAIGLTVPALSQTAVAPGQQEAERLYRQSIIDTRNNRLYSDEVDRCRGHISEEKFDRAIASCTRVIDLAQNLEPDRILERTNGHILLGISYLRLMKIGEALESFQNGRAAAGDKLTDSDPEMGDIYFLIGQAHHLGENIGSARAYYEKAESTYRKAFEATSNDEFFVENYAKTIRSIVEAHLLLVRNAGLESATEELRQRLAQVDREFAKYLKPSK